MAKRIYVGNLGYDTRNADLEQLFSQFGTVRSAEVVLERDSNRSKGFGFVEMSTDDESDAAIATLNGKELGGRALTVNEAKPRVERSDRGGGGGYSGGGGGRSRGW
jgi:RNA recognition motif-containing protein